ncbi:MAG: peptide deformylase [Patescibacteria group bacterium]
MEEIVVYPQEILRKKTENIKSADRELGEDIGKLVRTLAKSENGAGLAAPQIGLSRRFFAQKDVNTGIITVYINPVIERTFGEKDFIETINKDDKGNEKKENFLEGCLSFPQFYGTVKRYVEIDGSWDELVGEELKRKMVHFRGFEAIVFQHELDHLDGVLFVDHVKRDGGKFYKDIGGKLSERNVDDVIGGSLSP